MRQAVIDTSVFVSALRSRQGASHRLLVLLGGGDFEVTLSVPLVLEYEDAAKRLAREFGLSHGEIDDIIDHICSVGRKQKIHFLWRPFLKDPQDDHVLELAVAGGCKFIITHNVRDFSGSEKFGVRVVTPRTFLQVIRRLP